MTMARRDDKAPLDGRTRELLGAYRAELLRWNQQINLLSRRDAEGTADTLIRQCLDAFEMWWLASGAELTAGGALRLFDLGSGGGLPAFVWLAQLKARGVVTRATLVEPRAKRAWFLERLTHLPGAPAFEVVASRWGDRLAFGPFGPEAPTADAAVPLEPILFTLKALRLPENTVLDGLGDAEPLPRLALGATVELVRFQPSRGVTAARLARELDIPATGTAFSREEMQFEAGGCRLLEPKAKGAAAAGAAGLLVSRHRLVGVKPLG
jgi:hypothetical protein